MIPKECKRLAEVDFPIAMVSKHSAREKSIRHGHPSTLHLWWARRPLGACRAMLLGLLLPDPCDPNCPGDFKERAREILPAILGKVGPSDEELRQGMLKFIGEFSNWNVSADRTFIEVGRGLIKAAHPQETPLVVDPFAGGGSIPLEALRLGCEAFASDLNPVACLILKVMLEDIPRHGPELAEELRRAGVEIKKLAEKDLAEFYPKDPDGATPIAYLWARTVKCESPNCGAEIPLMRSFWLCKKGSRKRALRQSRLQEVGQSVSLPLELFTPDTDSDLQPGTAKNGRAICHACGNVLPSPRVQAQLTSRRGGAEDARLLAVVVVREDFSGRDYRLPTERDRQIVNRARDRLHELLREGRAVPDLTEPLSAVRPSPNARGVSAPTRYGADQFKWLFSPRQRLALLRLCAMMSQQPGSAPLRRLLAFVLDKIAMQCNAHCRWKATGESLVDMFGRHAISMVWDFAEAIPTRTTTGGLEPAVDWLAKAVDGLNGLKIRPGQVHNEEAGSLSLPDQSAQVWFTDPPYYDNIPYADLSDFFFVWLRRFLGDEPIIRNAERLGNGLTPKEKEAVWNYAHIVNGRPKGPEFFESTIVDACGEGRRILSEAGVGCVVFAHKTTEGWEALLTGIVQRGWVVTASWPIATEMATRVSARDSASLATSVHLVCRPRLNDAPVGDWGEVLRELPKRVGNWMERLQAEGIRGADLVFACIGPALEIFSRYSKVVDAEEREIPLGGNPEASEPHQRGFLSYVWEVVGRTALEQVLGSAEAKSPIGAAGAVEEDARLTALFLWTLQSTNGNGAGLESEEEADEDEADEETTKKKKKPGFSLIFDVVRRFAQPLGIHLTEWEGRIIETEKGVVRLLSIQERAKALFGEGGAQAVADRLESSRGASPQLMLFPQARKDAPLPIKGRKKRPSADVSDEALRAQRGATSLDRVHAAMLLQANGRANALRALLKDEQERGPDFLRLANALSALYPKKSEEKRLLDAMLLAMPR